MPSIHTLFNGRGGIKEVLAIALPMVVSMAADTLMAFTDRLFLARLSPEHMNAAMGGSLGAQMLMFFFIGLTGFSTALVAQYFGAGKQDKCPVVWYQSLLVIIAAVPIIILLKPLVLLLFKESISSVTQLNFQIEYFNIIIYGCFFFMLRHTLGCYFSGIGQTRIVMFANLAALVANVGINWVLIFGNFGFPAMGVTGAAIGSISGMFLSSVILMARFSGKRNRREFQPFLQKFFDKTVFYQLLKFGYPAGVELFFNFGAFTVLMHIFYSHSPELSTSVSILFNWDAISFIPLIGLEIAVTSLVGRYIGQKRLAFAHRSVRSSISVGLVYSMVIFLLFLFVPQQLVLMFSPDEASDIFTNAIPVAVSMLRIASIYILTEVFMIVYIGALRGAGDTLWTMAASIIIHWLFVAVGYVMLKMMELPPVTAWYGIVFSFMLFGLVFFLRYRQGKWTKIDIIGKVS